MARKGTFTKTFTFDGKRHYVTGVTEQEAIEKRAVLKAQLEAGKIIISRDTYVRDWIQEWLTTYKEGAVNDRWLADMKGICARYIVPVIGGTRISAVKPLHVKKILAQTGDMSASMNAKLYDILNQIFTTACDNRMIERSPMQGIKKPKGSGTNQRRSITDRERELTLKAAEYHRGGLFILLMLYCGLRPQEIVPLQWSDVDLKKKRIRIYKALKSDGTVQPFTKTEAGKREVPIPNVLIPRLQSERSAPFGLVCSNTRGERYTASSVRAMWENFKRELNILAGCRVFRNQLVPPYPIAEDLTLYCYRHTYCTDLQSAGVPINVAKELMGHASITVTASIYTHKSEEATRNAADLINAHVGNGVVQSLESIEKCTNRL